MEKKKKGEERKGEEKIISITVQFLKLVRSPKVNFCVCEEFEENPFSCFRGFRAWKQHLVWKSKIKRNSPSSSESKWVLVSCLWFSIFWAVPWRKLAISLLFWKEQNCVASTKEKNQECLDRRTGGTHTPSSSTLVQSNAAWTMLPKLPNLIDCN